MIEQHAWAMAWLAMAQDQMSAQPPDQQPVEQPVETPAQTQDQATNPPPMAGANGAGEAQTPLQTQPPAGRQPAPQALGPNFMWIILIGVVLMVFMMSMSQRKERKRRDQMLAAIKKNDRVQTTGGVIGRVVEIKDDEIVLKVDEAANTRIRFARAAVQNVLKEAPAEGPADNAAAK